MVLNGIFSADQGFWFVFYSFSVSFFIFIVFFFLKLFTILPCYMVFESHSSCFLYIHMCVYIYVCMCIYTQIYK